MENFWRELEKPILVLAPMADVTDSAFRHVISKNSKSNPKRHFVTYTEFVSADGLCLAPENGRQKLLKDLQYSEIERPIVAQFFTSRPENMQKVAGLALELGFDGVDINMGCPDKSIEKQGAGAALIKNPKLAGELIAAAKRGVSEAAKKLNKPEIPVSLKTRIGFNKDELEEWFPELLAEKPAAIILHLRTRKEMSKVPAHWERMKRAVEIRNDIQETPPQNPLPNGEGAGGGEISHTLIIGNGDVRDVEHALSLAQETGCDGVMLGRAVFGTPWLFSEKEPDENERLRILREHILLFEDNLGGVKSFAIMKKHFKSYLTGIKGSYNLRDELMSAQSAEDAIHTIDLFLNNEKLE